ncbi:10865_t:CDS:1, partial [Dentiscutata erythropus]
TINNGGIKSRLYNDGVQMILPPLLLIIPSFISPLQTYSHLFFFILKIYTILMIFASFCSLSTSIYEFRKNNYRIPNENGHNNTLKSIYEKYKIFAVIIASINFLFNFFLLVVVALTYGSASFPFIMLIIIVILQSIGNLHSIRFIKYIKEKFSTSSQDINAIELQDENASMIEKIEATEITKRHQSDKKEQHSTFALGYTIRTLHFATITYFFSNSNAFQWVTGAILFSAQTSLHFASYSYDLKENNCRKSSFLCELDHYFHVKDKKNSSCCC